MQELINSMVKFSAAMAMFSMEQMRTSAKMAMEPKAAMWKFKDSLDAVTAAINSKLEKGNQETADKISKTGSDIMDRTMTVVSDSTTDLKEMLQAGTEMLRKASETMVEALAKMTDQAKAAAGEPQAAAEALSPKS
ncbi:MAG: hypothetical protein FJW39_01650 [Acidobacteria bacterium]|nr:hypothetical protein [Acidobacteriota bacterium]